MANPVYEVGLEFVSGSYTNVASYCQRVSISRDRASIFESLSPGRCDLTLDNYTGMFSPENAASPYAPNLKPNKKVRILAVYNVTTYQLFNGFVDRWEPNPDLSQRTTHVQATDRMKDLARRRIDTAIAVNIGPSSLATDILSAAGVSSADRTIDAMPSLDSIPFAWFREYEPARALEDVARSNYSYLWVSGDGKVNVRTRYWGLGSSAVASYVNDFFGFNYTLADDAIINASQVQGQPRRIASSVQTVAWLTERPYIPASNVLGFIVNFLDPDTLERDTPAKSLSVTRSADYLTNTQSDGLGTDLTATTSAWVTFFGTTAVATMFNGSANGGYLTQFQVRGFSIQHQPDINLTTADGSSQTVYGVRNFTLASDLIGTLPIAQAYADFLVFRRKTPFPDISFTLKNVFPDVLAREIGDIVYLVESNTAVGTSMVITGIAHDIAMVRGLEHTASFTVHMHEIGPWIILDHATFGKLDAGRELAF